MKKMRILNDKMIEEYLIDSPKYDLNELKKEIEKIRLKYILFLKKLKK